MARIPKYLQSRPVTPGWVYTVEALALALLVHGVLIFLADYQPGKRAVPVRRSPGVTLLTRSGMAEEDWKKLLAWTSVHDPAQISRSDGRSGYSALLEKHRPRAVGRAANELAGVLSDPGLPVLPGFAALEPVPAAGPEPYRVTPFDEPAPLPIPAVKEPFVTDGNGERLMLGRLRMPEGNRKPVMSPTVVSVWENSGMTRSHLVQSCGVPALDRAALEAIAGERFESRKTLIVYWPEPAVPAEPEEVKP